MSPLATASAEAAALEPPYKRVLVPVAVALALLALGVLADVRLAAAAVIAIAGAAFVARTLEKPLFGMLVMVGAASLDIYGRVAKVSGVTITLYQLCALLTVVAVAYAMKRGDLRPVSTPMDLPVIAFIGLVLVAIPAAIDSKLALVSAASLVSSAVMLFLVAVIARDVPSARAIVIVLALAGAALGFLAVVERQHIFAVQGSYIELWRDGIRARVTFKDPNILGSFLAASSLLAGAWAIGEDRRSTRLLLVACSLAAAAGIYGTLSRGAAGAWLIGVVLIVALSKIPVRWKIAMAAALGLSIAGALAFVLDPNWVQAKIVGVTSNASAMYRVWMARGALAMFRDYPMGIGPGNYPVLFPLYRDAFVKTNLIESHTAYLTILVETGLFGIMAFVWLLWRYAKSTVLAVVRATDRRVHALAVGSLAAGAALAAQAFTYSLESSKILWLTFGLGMAAFRLASDSRVDARSEGSESE